MQATRRTIQRHLRTKVSSHRINKNRTWHVTCAALSSSSQQSAWQNNENEIFKKSNLALMGIAAAFGMTGYSMTANNDDSNKAYNSASSDDDDLEVSPAKAGRDDMSHMAEAHDSLASMPVYSSEDVALNDGQDGKPIWMSYGGVVYDVTDFINNHPGGSEKILTAAGSAIEPFWHVYRQHFASDLPVKLMERMMIGRLKEEDQESIDEQMEALYESSTDPYSMEPLRHQALRIHSDQPMNAECPPHLLTQSYLTPTSIFYIRHHHPVPILTDEDAKNYRLEIDMTALGKGKLRLSLDDLKKMEKVEVIATLQCSGNRRSGFNERERTSGTSWGQGAISTAKWGGVRLRDVLKEAGLTDPIEAEEKDGIKHVRFHALDGMMSSIGIGKAANPYGDCILCYEMNGAPLPQDHGFPVRAIVPGYAAVRNVKWVNKVELSTDEAEGPWQRGLNYKILPPSVTDANQVDLNKMPSMMEASLFSGITKLKTERKANSNPKPGDRVKVKAKGWAWSGGGRNIVRVDVTGDQGKSWQTAELKEGNNQKTGRAWGWVFWECELPAIVQDDGRVHIASKAVDMAFNVQPESCEHMWNVRGLGNNSWYRVSAKIKNHTRTLY